MNFDLTRILYILPGILIGLSFHEFAHAQTAVLLGDDTPKHQGRNSLNPFVHLDPIGFMMILLAGFGWAKPVMINPNHFQHPKRDNILVSLAGPGMNFLLAIAFVAILKVLFILPDNLLDVQTFNIVVSVLDSAVWINVVLMIFNLLPIPPLDGSHLVFGLTGLDNSPIYYKLVQMSTLILLVLILTNLLNMIIGPPISFIYQTIYGVVLK